jgi:hypothetical protein
LRAGSATEVLGGGATENELPLGEEGALEGRPLAGGIVAPRRAPPSVGGAAAASEGTCDAR